MRFVVVQFSAYLTEFRKVLLQSRYGIALRNLIFVKSDKRLYFLDNLQNEHCLSHPAWANITGEPATFPPGAHTHDWADVTGEPATFPPGAHTHDWADVTGEPATFPPGAHTHDWADVTGEPATFPPDAHTHPRIVGEVMIWTTDNPPTGWLLCYGQAVSRTTYAALFAVIGTTYGAGNNITTFNLPDLRGRVVLGQESMGGVSSGRVTNAAALGQGAGTETITLDISQMPSHNHSININGGAGSQGAIQVVGGGVLATPTNTTTTGNNQPHNNMPPYLTLNFVIYAG